VCLRTAGFAQKKKGLSGVLYATFRARCSEGRREGSGGLNVAWGVRRGRGGASACGGERRCPARHTSGRGGSGSGGTRAGEGEREGKGERELMCGPQMSGVRQKGGGERGGTDEWAQPKLNSQKEFKFIS
jgi:hypothetical protein